MSSAAPQAPTIRVEVAYSPRPRVVDVVELVLPAGSRVCDALRASGLVSRHGLDESTLRAGVWGRAQEPSAPLRDRDRVEIYRPLKVDPKEARRQRYRRHRQREG
jgi:putative ubiquitin-RnfH superfamily antitoxin RatB of RatAB toxin-antitoxin module